MQCHCPAPMMLPLPQQHITLTQMGLDGSCKILANPSHCHTVAFHSHLLLDFFLSPIYLRKIIAK